MFSIVIFYLLVLKMLYVLHKVFMYFLDIECKFFCSWGSGRCRGRRQFSREMRLETIVGNEWRHLHGFLKSIIRCKFCKQKQFELVILFVFAKNVKVSFQYLIYLFGLTVGSEIEHTELSKINFQNRSKCGPKIEHENRTMI